MTSLCSIFAGSEQPIDNSSGGGQSDDMKCSYGYSSHRGRRPTMEDFYQAVFVKSCNITVGLFGVFDGHGGPRVADFVCKNLFNNLIQNPQFITNTKNAIVEAFQQTDSEFLETESNTEHEYDAGSTASTAVLVGDRLLVANVGDSRAVACRDGKAVALSIDHKPDHEDERQRIEEAGGVVSWAGTWRVDGILAVSRAFGDKSLKQYVVADPDIKEEMVTNGVDFIIVASDGLWDVVSNEEAISMVQSISDAEEAAKMLTEEAFHRGSNDNITCIVVHFHNRG